ncbi:glutamate racemase [Marinobacter sp.]|uniref:glutamate racemase n=1 Tax=Marinobacter sp. TaxID=50741 RepID=UPI00356250E1
MDEHAPRVLVFDSGVGGLSVAACIHQALPGAELVYLADNAGFPYGNKPEHVVIDRCCSLIEECLRQISCDVIVIACNTASTVVLPHLRATMKIPVVGVVPAVKPAAACSLNRKVGLLATPATIKRPYLDKLIHDFAGDCEVTRVGNPNLVRWAEELVAGTAPPLAELSEAMAPLRHSGVDTVVLGCTHYPLLLPWLRRILPEVTFWVESGEAIARRVAYWLEQAGRLSQAERFLGIPEAVVVQACFTGMAPAEIALFMAEVGTPVASVKSSWPKL